MRYSTVLMVTTLVILLMIAAGCTSAPRNSSLANTTETTAQPGMVVTTAPPASTPAVPATTAGKCPSGQSTCADGTCRDTTSDHDACGGCGNVCPAGYVCKASSCINPAGPTAAATQVTTVAGNPVTTTVPTATPSLLTTYRRTGSIGSGLGLVTVAETTYPQNTQYIDCSKYPMSITSISPFSGPKAGGTPIVIHGSGFKRGSYVMVSVKFGPKYYVNLVSGPTSDTEIVLNTPAVDAPGAVNVQVAATFTGVSNQCLSPATNASMFAYT
jgi:hypothetical protein